MTELFRNPQFSNLQMTGKKCRIVFLDGTYVDFQPPSDFNFSAWITTMRSMGYVVADQFYCRGDLIKCIFLWDEQNPPQMPANAPTTETKQ